MIYAPGLWLNIKGTLKRAKATFSGSYIHTVFFFLSALILIYDTKQSMDDREIAPHLSLLFRATP